MAASIDNSARGFNSTPTTTLSSASFAVGGSNRVLYAFVESGAGTPVDPSTVKWNTSESLTQLGTTLNLGSNGKFSVWRLIAPSAATSTVDIVWGSSQDERLVIAVSVKDADQTTPNGTVASNTGTDTAPTVTATTVSGDLVLDGTAFLDGNGNARTLTVDASQTSLQEIEGTDMSFEGMGSSTETASGVSTVMSWAINDAINGGWGSFAFSINVATGGGGGDGMTVVKNFRTTYRPRPFGPGMAR